MKHKFFAEIKKHGMIDGAYIEIPFDVEKEFGAKRVKVKARFDGEEYRGSIVRMSDCYMIGLTQSLRKTIGKSSGDMIEVELEKDEEVREVQMPEDLKAALENYPDAIAFFEALSFTNKKEYVQWVISAKKAETRAARVEKSVLLLREKKKLR